MHGPWEAEVLVNFDDPISAPDTTLKKRIKVPCGWSDWLGDQFSGRVRFTRKFNCPTGLDPSQQVWLVVEQVDQVGDVFLNETFLGKHEFGQPPKRFEVQNLLTPANVLVIEVEKKIDQASSPGTGSELGSGGLIGSVSLEIAQSPTSSND